MVDKDKDDWLEPKIVAADHPELPELPGLLEEDDKTYLWPDGSPVSERSLPRHAPVSREGQTVHVIGPEPTHLGAAILAIFLGAWPLAIPAIVYGNRVGSTWARGDFEESARMSRLAGGWALAAYVPTLLLLALGLITAIVTSIASA